MNSGTADGVPVERIGTGGRQAVLASIVYALLFALSVAAVGILIGFASDDKGYARYRPWISEKLFVLNNRPPIPNVIFVGASVTLTTIIPEVIDAAAASEGCPDVHSINVAVPGARSFETAFMLDRVLEVPDLQPGSIIVYDVGSPEIFTFRRIAGSERTPVTLRLRYLPDLLSRTTLNWEGAMRIFDFTRAALGEALGMHALSDIYMRRWQQKKSEFLQTRVVDRGYVSASVVSGDKDRRWLLKHIKKFEKTLSKWNVAEFQEVPLPSNPFASQIRQAGFVPIAYAAPYPVAALAATVVQQQSADADLPAISITTENAPEVYAGAKLWIDRTHLSDEGARLVSPIVGRDLCRIMKSL